MLHLADSQVERLVDPVAAERAVWDAFAAWGRGEAATTQRIRAAGGGASGFATSGMISAMAAVAPPYSGAKVYATTVDPGGAARFSFVTVLFHVDGRLLATLDAGAVTALRTPAISSLAIHHLAASDGAVSDGAVLDGAVSDRTVSDRTVSDRTVSDGTQPGATVAAVIGAGNQGWPHVAMLGRALPRLADLRICARPGSPSAAGLVARAVAAGLPARLAESPVAAVEGAQVIVTATSAATPVFPSAAVADDALVCAVGATKYDRGEIDPELIGRCAAVVCDDVTGSRVECGDLIKAAAVGRFDWSRAIELHALAAGTVTAPRAGAAPVLFETQGVALADVAVSGLAYEAMMQEEP